MFSRFDTENQQPRRHGGPGNSSLEGASDAPHARTSVRKQRSRRLSAIFANYEGHTPPTTETQIRHSVFGAPASLDTASMSATESDDKLSTSEARPRLKKPPPTLRAVGPTSTIDERFEESGSEIGSIRGSSRRFPRGLYEGEAPSRSMNGREPVSERAYPPPGRRSPSPPNRRSRLWPPARAARPPSPADPPYLGRANRSYTSGQAELDSGRGAPEDSFSERREPQRSTSTLRRFQRRHAASDEPLARPPAAPTSVVLQDGTSHSYIRRPQPSVDSHADEDGWIEVPSRDGTGSERSIPISSPSLSQGREPSDDRRMWGGGERLYQSDVNRRPRRGKEIRKGYYRLYKSTGALLSVNPIYANDRSISSFDVEHVSPPRSAQNYIAYIAQLECIRPSGVKMYLTRPGGSPELVSNTNMVLNMSDGQTVCGRSDGRPLLLVVEPNNELPGRRYPSQEALNSLPVRDLDKELPYAHYRLFGVGPSSKAAQRPMPSHYPLYEDDLSLSALFIDYVPPPLRAKDYIVYISELEGIHPSRITLYLSPKPECGEVAEAQEIKKVQEIVTMETASSTSERHPIMVNVELEVDEYGNVHFGTKSEPLSRSIARRLSLGWSNWQKR